ncbi:unnamed protein product [Candidula unifasciata]|uniref:Uncharacterized protein n=1 Tax=Candidula unifasciata TaxID=100452 RepID=A0A8S3ZXW0_9EUPU|nr:unnamed protein product [Candidula unifasciata]
MSVLLLSGRKKVIETKKKIVKKVGKLDEGKAPAVTATWRVVAGGERKNISFSRDNMNVYLDGSPIECTAYVTDGGYDLDLLFNVGENHGHIYSDVEGTEMTNYLFFDDQLVAQEKQKNLQSKHQPDDI